MNCSTVDSRSFSRLTPVCEGLAHVPGPKRRHACPAKELGVSPSMLRRWREQFEPEPSGTAPVSQVEREEVERLRRELRDLQAENSLLKKGRSPSRQGQATL